MERDHGIVGGGGEDDWTRETERETEAEAERKMERQS